MDFQLNILSLSVFRFFRIFAFSAGCSHASPTGRAALRQPSQLRRVGGHFRLDGDPQPQQHDQTVLPTASTAQSLPAVHSPTVPTPKPAGNDRILFCGRRGHWRRFSSSTTTAPAGMGGEGGINIKNKIHEIHNQIDSIYG